MTAPSGRDDRSRRRDLGEQSLHARDWSAARGGAAAAGGEGADGVAQDDRRPAGVVPAPNGVVRWQPYPFRFIQNYTHKKPTHLLILYETMRAFRQVFVDGRPHPPEVDPTWFGHSIGQYEGATLVIDTVGFNEKAWYNGHGMPRTQQLHTVERWTRLDAGHMATEVLIDDPGTFSRPFSVKFESVLAQPGDELMEYVCQENNQYGVASGVR